MCHGRFLALGLQLGRGEVARIHRYECLRRDFATEEGDDRLIVLLVAEVEDQAAELVVVSLAAATVAKDLVFESESQLDQLFARLCLRQISQPRLLCALDE